MTDRPMTDDLLSLFIVELSRLESKNRPDLQGIVFGRGFGFHQSLVDDAVSNVRAALAATPEPTLERLAVKIADRLALVYQRESVSLAGLLDEQIDRSGNLLGWLREYARLHERTEP